MQVFVPSILLISLLAGFVLSTQVRNCHDGKAFENAEVTITGCETPPCTLKKKTKVGVSMAITPDQDIAELENSVFGNLLGLPLPFVGVDGTDACGNIYDAEGETNVGCPLKAGQKYTYKNTIDVLSIYPRVNVDVEWGLRNPKTDKFLKCFKVKSKIVN